ncbi:uncharacterized protein LOC26536203 [Drosophila yakuba]|uniref:Uncharacterized protein n=1 Tax=Drosophila yakuba TaxID=7245 RepID=A0A0R1EC96_DROYA|nr:uncharacterized protein LOC26536203 [Drosophila yakuba]KRK07126.1 uncharacterized protein Dyak_GE29022 [Drosophila yakuba]
MVGDPVDKRSIKITRRDNTVGTISDLHRSYDALQYPLIFWQGQDEYHLNIKQYDPNTGDYSNKKVSSMNYYAHRIMCNGLLLGLGGDGRYLGRTRNGPAAPCRLFGVVVLSLYLSLIFL